MRTVILSLVLMVTFLSGFSFNKSVSFENTLTTSAYAQEVEASPAAIEVVEKEVKIDVASDIQENKLEIPAWVGSIVMFIQATPVVGPHVIKALAFCGIIAALLTLLATMLMGLSGVLAIITKKASPAWLMSAKKWLDYAIQIVKYLSMYNVQKKK